MTENLLARAPEKGLNKLVELFLGAFREQKAQIKLHKNDRTALAAFRGRDQKTQRSEHATMILCYDI